MSEPVEGRGSGFFYVEVVGVFTFLFSVVVLTTVRLGVPVIAEARDERINAVSGGIWSLFVVAVIDLVRNKVKHKPLVELTPVQRSSTVNMDTPSIS